MSGLDRIVNITIDRQTKGVSQKGFGTALFVASDATEKPAGQTTRIRIYDQDSYKTEFLPIDEVYKACSAYFSQSLIPTQIMIGYVEGAETLTQSIIAIEAENPDFYAIGIQSVLQADQEALATYIESTRKIAVVRSNDVNVLAATTTDIAGVLNGLSRSRTAVIYGGSIASYQDMAWLGVMLPTLPGSATWKFKTLSGILADNLSGTSINNLKTKKANWYNVIGGISITEEGTMASGEFMDVIRGIDFIHARMQESVFSKLANLPKIPFTNKGAAIIENAIDVVLQLGENQGILASDPKYSITIPDVRTIAFNDRANRLLPNIKFEGVLAGAIHSLTINGVVTV